MKEHVTDLLSPFIDGQLAEAERRMVEAHVGKCEACERELKDLKGLTKLLAGVPLRPLPTGFHQRLERRRREAEAAPEPRHLLPMPARALAYSMSFAVVCFVAYDAFKTNASHRLAGSAAMLESAELKYVDGRARRATRLEAAKGSAFDSGEMVFGSSAEPLAAEEAAPSQAKKEARAPGAPLGVPDSAPPIPAPADKLAKTFSNDELQSHLEQERRKMGIAQIVPRGAAAADPADQPGPMSPAEAREYMRGMTEGFMRQRMAMDNYSEPVPLGAGSKPQLLKPQAAAPDGGAPLGETRIAANADRNSPARSPMIAMGAASGERDVRLKSRSANRHLMDAKDLQASAGMAQAPVNVVPYAKAEASREETAAPAPRADAEAARGKARSQGPAGAKLDASRPLAAARGGAGGGAGGLGGYSPSGLAAPPAAAYAVPKSAGAAAGPGRSGPAASAARSKAELEALWREYGKTGELPAVDFSTEMVVSVRSASPIEIVRVKTTRDRIVLECRPATGDGPATAFRVVPRSLLPVVVELTP